MRSPSHQIRQSLVGVIFSTLGGCANTGAPSTASDTESGWFDGIARTVAVVPKSESPPKVSLYFLETPPSHASGIAKAAGSGALKCLDIGGSDIITMMLTLGCMPLAAVAGAGEASSAERTPSEPYHRAAGDMALLNGARERLEQSLGDRRPELLVSQKIVSLMQGRADHDVRLEQSHKQAEESVRDERLDWLLEIRLTDFGLVIDESFDKREADPMVALLMIVSAVNNSLSGEFVAPEKQAAIKYVGQTRRFSELMAENGRLMDQDIEHGTTKLAELVVK